MEELFVFPLYLEKKKIKKKGKRSWEDIINSLSKLKQSSRAPLNISGSFLLSANDISLILLVATWLMCRIRKSVLTLLKAAGLKYMILKCRHMLSEISHLTHRHHSLQIFRLAALSVRAGRLFKNTLQLSQLTVSAQMTHANELVTD